MKTSKKIPSTLILFSGIFLFAFSFSDAQLIPVDAQEFRQAPDYKAIALDGTPVSIDDYQDKVILVNLWATWCETCREEKPALASVVSESNTWSSRSNAFTGPSPGKASMTISLTCNVWKQLKNNCWGND